MTLTDVIAFSSFHSNKMTLLNKLSPSVTITPRPLTQITQIQIPYSSTGF